MSFHFSRFFSFTFLSYNSICAELQGGPRERKEVSRQKRQAPEVRTPELGNGQANSILLHIASEAGTADRSVSSPPHCSVF